MKNTCTNVKSLLYFSKLFLKNNAVFNYIFVVCGYIVNNINRGEQFCKGDVVQKFINI